ncbi:Putative pentatricopeptide repeat-containing protein At1g77010, mitochondrial [Linum perenne]
MDAELHSLARLLQSFTTPSLIRQGKQLHLHFFKKGLIRSTVSLANRILQMYSRCGNLTDAHKLFDEMTDRNCFSWNTMIEGYMNAGDKGKSLELFDSMPCKNDYSWNVVVSGFAKFGDIATARKLFDVMPRRDGVAWNSVIHGYVQNGLPNEAVKLFRILSMDPCEESNSDGFVLATVIGACTDMGAVNCGKQIHARILSYGVEFDAVMASSLTNLYAKCGDFDSASFVLNMMGDPDDFSISALVSGYASCGRLDDARRLLDRTSNRSTVVWNSLLSGSVANRDGREAVKCFGEMQSRGIQVDFSTITSILSASVNYKHVLGIHAYSSKVGFIHDVVVCSALIDAYSKCGNPNNACELFNESNVFDTVLLNSMITVYSNCGRIQDAKHIFSTMPSKSLISWNSMAVALSKNGCPIEALDIFCEMNMLGLRLDEFSLASVVSTCAAVSSIELGEQAFARATKIGLDSNPAVSTSLVDFYCKCGFVETGRKIFDAASNKLDQVCWNSMLMGYATNGQGSEALTLFNTMRHHARVPPSDITFTAVLSACDHCGLVEEGWKWFHEMKQRYHIEPGIEHYSCMIDLFARAGRIEEAMDLIDHMPFKADATMWSSVLRGCVAHGDAKLGEKVAERIIELDPENASAYIQLSGMFADSGKWESSSLIRNMMRENQVKKLPGYSWAEC